MSRYEALRKHTQNMEFNITRANYFEQAKVNQGKPSEFNASIADLPEADKQKCLNFMDAWARELTKFDVLFEELALLNLTYDEKVWKAFDKNKPMRMLRLISQNQAANSQIADKMYKCLMDINRYIDRIEDILDDNDD